VTRLLLLKFLRETRQDFGCDELALRCDCENLETVYVIERYGELAVTDRGETFQYLERSGDDAYAGIGVERARAICDRHGVELDDGEADGYPKVIDIVRDKPARAAIEAVSAAVGELFSAALVRPRGRSDSLPR
jgi:hypothetical protein